MNNKSSKTQHPDTHFRAMDLIHKNPDISQRQLAKETGISLGSMHYCIKAAQAKTIVTLGITPTRPDTGFGYIHYEDDAAVKSVLTFKEKPELEAAKKNDRAGPACLEWRHFYFAIQDLAECN